MKRLAVLGFAGLCAVAPQSHAQTPESLRSQLSTVEVASVTPAGTFNGVAYVKVAGTVHGRVGINDHDRIVGLMGTRAVTDPLTYDSNFELVVPAAGAKANEVLYMDSENRGSAISQGALGGFLQTHATSYARVQWQAGISKGVPEDMQGVGLIIMRDFARWLGGRTPDVKVTLPKAAPKTAAFKPVAYRKMILGGISQSAWFVNTFIAERFNQEPLTGQRIFDAAIAIDGTGNWLTINQLGYIRKAGPPIPYMAPNSDPLTRSELLKRPPSDPLYIDVANYTDFYRLRASLTSTSESTAMFRRYDWPSPHANSANPRCNNGQPITVNPVRYSPYFRALVLNVEKAIGVKAAQTAPGLPPSTVFSLTQTSLAPPLFNPLPGADVKVPVVDQNGWPVGGVRFPEAMQPTGRPDPVSVPPVDTTSINNTCGNSGGWKTWDAAQLTARYKDKTGYLVAYAEAVDDLIKQGFVLAEDRAGMLKTAEGYWTAS
jgi:hypothetical protein